MNVTVTRRLGVAAALAGAVWATGCATADEAKDPQPRPTREYRTGSNIPIKDPLPEATAEERERTQEELRRIQGASMPKPSGSTR